MEKKNKKTISSSEIEITFQKLLLLSSICCCDRLIKQPCCSFLFSQVVMKIIKHYQEEGQGSEVVQGVLLGLVVDDRLEITNCFPFPQHTEDDADFDEGNRERCLDWKRTHSENDIRVKSTSKW